jgi:hypothetical protein
VKSTAVNEAIVSINPILGKLTQSHVEQSNEITRLSFTLEGIQIEMAKDILWNELLPISERLIYGKRYMASGGDKASKALYDALVELST